MLMMEGLFFQHLPPTLPSPRLRLRRLRVCGASSRAELMASMAPSGSPRLEETRCPECDGLSCNCAGQELVWRIRHGGALLISVSESRGQVAAGDYIGR